MLKNKKLNKNNTKTLIFLCLLLPLHSFAGISLSNSSKLKHSEGCGAKNRQLNHLTKFQETICKQYSGIKGWEDACDQVNNVAWYADRDNTMVDVNDEVARAMAVVISPYQNVSIGTQVCPNGTYDMTGHGSILDPGHSKPQSKSGLVSFTFPFSLDNRLVSLKNENFKSPFLNQEIYDTIKTDADAESDKDYALVKMGKVLPDTKTTRKTGEILSENYVTPLILTASQLAQLTQSGKIKVHLYRGKPSKPLKNNLLNYHDNSGKYDEVSFAALTKLYDNPQRVNIPITFYEDIGVNYALSDAPIEKRVSGSPFIAKINGKNFLVGRAVSSEEKIIESQGGVSRGSNVSLITDEYCSDLDSLCEGGNKCATFDDIKEHLNKPEQTASLDL